MTMNDLLNVLEAISRRDFKACEEEVVRIALKYKHQGSEKNYSLLLNAAVVLNDGFDKEIKEV